MHQAPPSSAPSALSAFEAFLLEAPRSPGGAAPLDPLLSRLEAETALEDALALFKRRIPGLERGRDPLWRDLGLRLSALAAKARERRMNAWQRDPLRCTLRLAFQCLDPMVPSALQGALAQAFQAAGMPVALGLEKAPRPLVHLAHPLPPSMGGLREWADVVLREPLPGPLHALPGRLAPHLPQGCAILEAALVPNHGSSVPDLAREARWAWPCPPDLLPVAKARLEAFRAASAWEIGKTGKVDGHKVLKRLEVRHLVPDLSWEGDTLRLSTLIGPGEAMNPQKLLGGILEVEPSAIQGMSRQAVVLGEDPRLARPEIYEPKLHNMYEDAVLLESAPPSPVLDEDEDDDEPTILNR